LKSFRLILHEPVDAPGNATPLACGEMREHSVEKANFSLASFVVEDRFADLWRCRHIERSPNGNVRARSSRC
jgi:hypothetical protein